MSYYDLFLKGRLTLEEAFVKADNDYYLIIHSGIYSGEKYDSIVFDRALIACQMARRDITAQGYNVENSRGFREWIKGDTVRFQ